MGFPIKIRTHLSVIIQNDSCCGFIVIASIILGKISLLRRKKSWLWSEVERDQQCRAIVLVELGKSGLIFRANGKVLVGNALKLFS